VCVNAKFWDDGAYSDCLNLKMATAAKVPRDDFNAMEMSFLRYDARLHVKWRVGVASL
jgi:hypothetical protein